MKTYPEIDTSWTLFLDRDGVINRKIDGDYVRNMDMFSFLPGAIEAICNFGQLFGRIIVVTNQQGIGKGLMSKGDLEKVHGEMLEILMMEGGRIDEIYYCPDLAYELSNCRKPNPTMAIQAKTDFPEIDFKKSIMVGDSDSDILFGKQLGMTTVKISQSEDETADYTHPSLHDFYLYLNN